MTWLDLPYYFLPRLTGCGALSLELLGFGGSLTIGGRFPLWLVELVGKELI